MGEGKKREREEGACVRGRLVDWSILERSARHPETVAGRWTDGPARLRRTCGVGFPSHVLSRYIYIYFFCVHISFSATIQKKKTNKRKGWEYLREEAAGKEKKMKEKKKEWFCRKLAHARVAGTSEFTRPSLTLVAAGFHSKTKNKAGWMDGWMTTEEKKRKLASGDAGCQLGSTSRH